MVSLQVPQEEYRLPVAMNGPGQCSLVAVDCLANHDPQVALAGDQQAVLVQPPTGKTEQSLSIRRGRQYTPCSARSARRHYHRDAAGGRRN